MSKICKSYSLKTKMQLNCTLISWDVCVAVYLTRMHLCFYSSVIKILKFIHLHQLVRLFHFLSHNECYLEFLQFTKKDTEYLRNSEINTKIFLGN